MTDRAFEPLDLATAPLAGTVLVEASAGTGKTWTIAALVLRLLLEPPPGGRPRRIEEILVVTYTKAATAELRERILARIASVREALEAGRRADPLEALAHKLAQDAPDEAIAALDLAIESFDLAPVFTIHGFCQRVLAEHAFESAMPFATEIVEDETPLREQAAQDFWRREIGEASRERAAELIAAFKGPEGLLARASPALDRPYASVVGVDVPVGIEAARDRFQAAFARARAEWPGARADLARAMHEARLNQTSYPAAKLDEWWSTFDAYFTGEAPGDWPDKLPKLAPAALEKGRTKNGTVPAHPFVAVADELVSAEAALATACAHANAQFVQRFATFCRDELARRKRERGLQSYDDLLRGLRDALQGEGGEALAETLRARYTAALVDEAQDTDPVQMAIFERIWAGTGLPLYLVGDPKQAIYGFRGADVFAYLRARSRAQHRYTLAVNQRSDPAVLEAVAALFGRESCFLIPEIDFVAVKATDRPRVTLLIEDGARPFTVWRFDGAAAVKKDAARERIGDAVATDIARLLALAETGRTRFTSSDGATRILVGGDIAVLVGTHAEGDVIRQALASRGIASVTYGAQSVFDSHEAVEMERLLLAIAEPGRETLLRAALATDFFGLDARALDALAADGPAWETWVARFRSYHDLARTGGFVRMWRELSIRERLPARLLAHPDGERRMTNIAHLVELLHQRAEAEGLDLAQLARALVHARGTPIRDPDAEQLRLESDRHLVNIVTVHRAKGLEFPIVYCPFLWDAHMRAGAAPSAVYHDDADHHAARVDLGSPDLEAHRHAASVEELAGALRLAYVALTRARHRCVTVWGALPGAATSALAWLLHPQKSGSDPIAAMKTGFKGIDDAAVADRLEQLAADAPGAIGVVPLGAITHVPASDARPAPAPLSARVFPRVLSAAWRMSSFSGLVSRTSGDARDYDLLGALPRPRREEPRRDAFGLPRGVRFGTLVHRVFERLDFRGATMSAIEAAVERELPRSGVDAEWQPVIAGLVADTLGTALDTDGFSLSALARERRLDELEFTYPIAGAEPADLAAAFAPLGRTGSRIPEAIGSLVIAPAAGFMRGFIDLAFEHGGRYFIADYKSNWLGDRLEDYAPERLAEAMAEAFYDLQYLVYTVALHRFLGSRLPDYDYDRDFGGVYYLFVRGMRPGHGPRFGVYFTRPDRGVIETLDACLAPAAKMILGEGER